VSNSPITLTWRTNSPPIRKYKGPRFSSCLKPATWATRYDFVSKKFELRNEFKGEWYAITKPLVYVHRSDPSAVYNKEQFNSLVAPFADVQNVAGLLDKSFYGKADELAYEPGTASGLIVFEGKHVVNTYLPSPIVPMEGDPKPFLDFMAHLIPPEEDRKHVMKWCATLIAVPSVRITYGLLLVSENQRVGKGTLGEKILAPLVGMHNTSFPSEHSIVDSSYNSWLVHKRLVVVREIYAGQSSKAYDKLKSLITDKQADVHIKYLSEYTINLWNQMFACSNSLRALKLSEQDARWLVPKCTEERKEYAYWRALNRWLTRENGLAIIAHWAREYVKEHGHVETGEHPPDTVRKRELTLAGMSDGEQFVHELGTRLKGRETNDGTRIPTVMRLDKVRGWLSAKKADFSPVQYSGGRMLERPERIAGILRGCGLWIFDKQLEVKEGNHRMRFQVVANYEIGKAATWTDLKGHCVAPEDLDDL
jgi:hypothetical protein